MAGGKKLPELEALTMAYNAKPKEAFDLYQALKNQNSPKKSKRGTESVLV